MTTTEKISRRKPGRPRKYGQGRINAACRFTPERYEELKAEADQNGRSVSEQIEHMVEQTQLLRDLIGTLKISLRSAHEVVASAFEHQAFLRREIDRLKAMHAAEEERRLAEIIEAAVARAIAAKGEQQ